MVNFLGWREDLEIDTLVSSSFFVFILNDSGVVGF